MKVFTFFYNRFESATTSIALFENGIDHFVMIHTAQDLTKFEQAGTLKGKPIVTDQKKGLAYQRNCALDMLNEGEWGVFMCDDFTKIRSYPTKWILSKTDKLPINFENQNAFRLHGPSAKYSKEMQLDEMFTMFPKLIEIAEKNQIHLIGFGLHDNPLNLKKKFSFRGLADGRFWLVKKSNYKFDLNAQLIDDVAWTSENLIRHGNVLILNWTVPYFKRYSSGGFGSTEERKKQRKKECNYLANKFYPLVRVAKKSNWEYGTHIKIFGSDKNINLARKKILL
jgi:hypothetical protein